VSWTRRSASGCPNRQCCGLLDDYPTRSGIRHTPVVIWGGGRLVSPSCARRGWWQSTRWGYTNTARRFAALHHHPGEPRPVVQIPLGNHLIHAPTGSVLFAAAVALPWKVGMTRSMSSSNPCSPGSRPQHPSGTNVPGTTSALPRLATHCLRFELALRDPRPACCGSRTAWTPTAGSLAARCDAYLPHRPQHARTSATQRPIATSTTPAMTKAESSNLPGSNSASDCRPLQRVCSESLFEVTGWLFLAPQGLDYVAGFFAAIKAGAIAVPLFRARITRPRRTSRGCAP